MDGLDGVVRPHTFTTVGGLTAKDSLVHFTIYASKDAVEKVGAHLSASKAFTQFRDRFAANTIAFATAD